jgi:hypothetical protein
MVQLRPGSTIDLDFLKEMLFEAFFWDLSTRRPVFTAFRDTPEFSKLLTGWGRKGDRAIIAEESRTRIGAAWFRLAPGLSSQRSRPQIARSAGSDGSRGRFRSSRSERQPFEFRPTTL